MSENGLCGYYNFDSSPGIKAKGKYSGNRFAYLDDDSIIRKLVKFQNSKQVNVTFTLPQVHCSSCIYLLENLHRIEEGVISSVVNFQRKEIFIIYNPSLISLRKIVELLSFIGYEPSLSLKDAITGEEKNDSRLITKKYRRKQITRIGVAGFCFSNIMMLSFPEYLSSGTVEAGLKNTFTWAIVVLSLPVLFFSAAPFFTSAWKGLRQRYINIDAPIALASAITFTLSYYQVLTDTGPGYLDSGAGIIFFMLVGRWFQDKTYDALSFDRDYLSYLPLSVTTVHDEPENGAILRREQSVPVNKLKKGDHILIHNNEIIPADARLLEGSASIDYSFVNGENDPVSIKTSEHIYAGGRQIGPNILLVVEQEASHSYITNLWNNDVFKKQKHASESYIHPWSRYFTLSLFGIAAAAAVYWAFVNPANIATSVVSVLIVACPCSLLLSATFTYGNMLRIFGRNKLYLKNAHVIEALANVDNIVFDKTGTLTQPNKSIVHYRGTHLSDKQKSMLNGIGNQTTHPFGKLVATQFTNSDKNIHISSFEEIAGLGVKATIDEQEIRVGSDQFIPVTDSRLHTDGSRINVEIEKKFIGSFYISNHYRDGIKNVAGSLEKSGYGLHVLSGDNDREKENLGNIFGKNAFIKFKQLPADKLEYIQQLQAKKKNILMLGDGLNDAGALMQADVGIAINNNDSQFTPACDAILDANQVGKLDKFLRYARTGKKIITASFILSIAYNLVGFSFAVSASLSPLVAAILMPASSISIVSFVTLAGNISARRLSL